MVSKGILATTVPELPDIELYLAALRHHAVGKTLTALRVASPIILKTVSPSPSELAGQTLTGVRRLGKRLVFEFSSGPCVIVHLMIAGRFRWLIKPLKADKMTHADFVFGEEALRLTEASKHKRASLHIVRSSAEADTHDPGGVDPLSLDIETFLTLARRENRTVKRFLTHPQNFSGIGNAYSDEILHAAKVSPIRLTSALTPEESARLVEAMKSILELWRDRLIEGADGGRKFPGLGEVTAFRPDFAVHGRFNKPCPVCGAPVQRIVYAENETNYCAVCQTGGKVLADRSMSRLLKDDWPRTLEGFE